MNKYMEIRVEGSLVGRPRTLLEIVETDMAELEINREDIHVRKKRYEEGVQHYRKMDYKTIIII